MDHNKEAEKKIKQLREDYKTVFGSEEGKRVLEDISIRCHESSTTFSIGIYGKSDNCTRGAI